MTSSSNSAMRLSQTSLHILLCLARYGRSSLLRVLLRQQFEVPLDRLQQQQIPAHHGDSLAQKGSGWGTEEMHACPDQLFSTQVAHRLQQLPSLIFYWP